MFFEKLIFTFPSHIFYIDDHDYITIKYYIYKVSRIRILMKLIYNNMAIT